MKLFTNTTLVYYLDFDTLAQYYFCGLVKSLLKRFEGDSSEMGVIKVTVRNRKGKPLGSQIPVKWSMEQLSDLEVSTPGTLLAFYNALEAILDYFNGANQVHQGVYQGHSVGFVEDQPLATPTNQTHEERVRLVYDVEYTGGTVKVASISIPCPNLDTEFPFPAGQDKIYASDYPTLLGANAIALVALVQSFIENYGFNNIVNVTSSYVELAGSNT